MSEVNAVEKENVLIQAGSCVVSILPHLGGKIASLRVGNNELLQAPLAAYGPRTRTMSFDAGDAGGWDECLPSVASCVVETEGGQALIPDHGDVWRVEWQVIDSRDVDEDSDEDSRDARAVSSLTASAECFSLPLRMDRSLDLVEEGTAAKPAWLLHLGYTLTNMGSFPAPWSWAAHPLFAVEEGDRVVLPDSIRSLRVEGSAGGRLGRQGSEVSWPMVSAASGAAIQLDRVLAETSGVGEKLFAGPLSATENWCMLERPKAGLRISVGMDVPATPYLGLWLCYGGWPERPEGDSRPKQMCVAMEPATAPRDSLAETGEWSQVLAAGDSCSWWMDVRIETI